MAAWLGFVIWAGSGWSFWLTLLAAALVLAFVSFAIGYILGVDSERIEKLEPKLPKPDK